ncbi:hypothetical protein BJ944DRAFT_169594 [Cunninghamella echinulata]|nr:hypothetical protein BJ944DRAFT_169594 [Cunninghamella echinulata]
MVQAKKYQKRGHDDDDEDDHDDDDDYDDDDQDDYDDDDHDDHDDYDDEHDDYDDHDDDKKDHETPTHSAPPTASPTNNDDISVLPNDGVIETPQNEAWLESVELEKVPDLPIRKVGSGICADAKCDGTDNDRCFESCGNKATKEDIYGCKKKDQWALTFDDGPSQYTEKLLDILKEENVKATFCVMGHHAKKYTEFLKRAYKEGHQIASHTYSHPHLMSLTNEEIIYEMRATEEVIYDAIGIRPTYMRPPFGEADARVKALLKAMDYKVLMWNVDPRDYDVYMKPDAGQIIRHTFDKALNGNDTGLNPHKDPGFISLQHDLYKESIAEVSDFIKKLKSKNYNILTAAECLEDPRPHDDDNELFSSSKKNDTSIKMTATTTNNNDNKDKDNKKEDNGNKNNNEPKPNPPTSGKSSNTKGSNHHTSASSTLSVSLIALFSMALLPLFLS